MIRVWRIPFSTNVERVALALAHKGLEVDWVDVEPEDRSTVVRVSGQELVPVLEEDGEVVADSTAILLYLEKRHPGAPLLPSDPARRAELELFLDWFDRVWKAPPNALETELRSAAPDAGRVASLGLQTAGSLPRFEALLTGRDYLFGKAFSLADCAAFPFLKYALLHDPVDTELFHKILVEHLRLDGGFPQLEAWIRRVDTMPRA